MHASERSTVARLVWLGPGESEAWEDLLGCRAREAVWEADERGR